MTAGRAIALLRAANPVDTDDLRRELGPEEIEAARRTALTESGPNENGGSTPTRPRWGASRRLALVVAAAALAVTAALALLPGGSSGPVAPPDGLVAVAAVAESRPPITPGPGEFAYQRSRSWELVLSDRVDERVRSQTTEVWLSAEGHGVVERHPEREAPCRSPEESLRRSLGLVCIGSAAGVPAPFVSPGFSASLGRTSGRVDDLPTDVDALEEALTANVRRSPGSSRFFADRVDPDVELFTLIGEVLANPLASPELRGALFRLLARNQAVRVQEGVTDPEGRSGNAATITARFHLPDVYKAGRGPSHFPGGTAQARYEIVFDPATSELLASRVVLLGVEAPGLDELGLAEIDGPTAIEHTVYVESGLVDSAEEVYGPRQAPEVAEDASRSDFATECPDANARFEEAGWDTSFYPGPPGVPCPGAAEVEALIEFCPPAQGGADTSCHVIDIDADERGGGPMTTGQALAELGIHPEECPDVVAAFEAAGAPPVDAFLGRCPTPEETERLLSGR